MGSAFTIPCLDNSHSVIITEPYSKQFIKDLSSKNKFHSALKIKLPNDSEIIITSEGLLGGNYVSISPGGSDIFLKANEKFSFTQSSLSLNNLIQKFFGK